jgi:uncharacterized protein (TIGR03083 family)
MTELVDRTIAALRANHVVLEAVVSGLSTDQLNGPSGASDWTVAQVLSHLGSGAEITLNTIGAAVPGASVGSEDNQTIWARWDAASAEDQAAWFLDHDERLLTLLEGTTPEQRQSLTVDMGFLPEPASLGLAVGMRLNEVAAHAWDVRVGVDPAAALDEESAALLARHFSGELGFLLGFVGKPDLLEQRAVVAVDGYQLVVDDSVALASGADQDGTATFTGPLEAAVRLLSGRLRPEFTPAGVDVTGNVTLAELRTVFPGY